ncbi:hypothetical protein QZH41_004652 [Actinostola sp. cb2023]|nr:hypothetical protein QZH41_004652 [Actinostola sp. cb2023]
MSAGSAQPGINPIPRQPSQRKVGRQVRLSYTEDQYNVLLLQLPKRIGRDWKKVGGHLGLQEYELRNIEDSYQRIEDKASEMLNTWKNTGKIATPQALATALKKADRRDLSDTVQDSVEREKKIPGKNRSRTREDWGEFSRPRDSKNSSSLSLEGKGGQLAD